MTLTKTSVIGSFGVQLTLIYQNQSYYFAYYFIIIMSAGHIPKKIPFHTIQYNLSVDFEFPLLLCLCQLTCLPLVRMFLCELEHLGTRKLEKLGVMG